MSTAVHLAAGDPGRALFTGFCGALFALLGLLLVVRDEDVRRLSHAVIGTAGVMVSLSPFMSTRPETIPLPLGLVALPVAAVLCTGHRAGLVWTLLFVAALAVGAASLPLDPGVDVLATNAAIVALILGASSAWVERRLSGSVARAEAALIEVERRAAGESRMAASLEEREHFLETLFRKSPVVLLLSEFDSGRIVDVNAGFEKLSGWTRAEVLGRTLTELDGWPSLEERDRLFEAFTTDDFEQTIETRMRARSGALFDILVSVEVVSLDGVAHLLAHAIDVTERRRKALEESRAMTARLERQEDALADTVAQLRRQERLASVGTLAAGIAHQINNPVGAIRAVAEMSRLELESGKTDRLESALDTIVEESQRCGDIVRGILQFSRDEPLSRWVGDLNPNVERAARLMQPRVSAHGCRLEVELHAEPLRLLLSPIGVEQIVVNLLQNAVDHAVGPTHVRLSTHRENDRALVRVADDGEGIDSGALDRVFDPFFTTRFGEGGTGLGLSVVHGLVNQHEGEVRIESPTDGGTIVEVSFPIHGLHG
ncbi:MAG: ATP-binding protein [Myxococcota bacterium]